MSAAPGECPGPPVRPGPLGNPGEPGAGEVGHHRVAPGARGLTWGLTSKPRKMMLDARRGYDPGRAAVPRRLSPGTADSGHRKGMAVRWSVLSIGIVRGRRGQLAEVATETFG